MMKVGTTALVFFAFIFTLKGQDVSFQVVDDSDGSVIPFPTIYFPISNVGYSANAMGYFSIEMNKLEPNDSLVISSLGYLTSKISVSDAIGQSEVRLKPDLKILDEVVISGKRENTRDRVKATDRFLRDYLGKNPYFLYAFYKETLQQGGHYTGYTEAYGVLHISGYQPSYNRKNRLFSYDLAQWKNIRRSEYSAISDCDTLGKAIAIDKLLMAKSEYIFDGPLNRLSEFDFNLDSAFSNNNDEILVVKFNSQEKQYSGELWIDEQTNALLSLKVHDSNIAERISTRCGEVTSANFEVNFIMLEGEYFINSVSLFTYDEVSEIKEELTIRGGEFKKNEVVRLNYDQRMIIYNEMLNPVIIYDSAFWTKNGVDISSQVQSDLSSETPLADQFFKMNGRRIIPLPEEFNSYEDLYKKRDMFRVFMLNSDF